MPLLLCSSQVIPEYLVLTSTRCVGVICGLIISLNKTLHELSLSIVTIAKCPTFCISLFVSLSYTLTNSPSSPSTHRVYVDEGGGGGGGVVVNMERM